MKDVLEIISVLCFPAFTVLYFLFFYLSMKKCFLRDGISKVRLFLLSIITNPILIFLLASFLGGMIVYFAIVVLNIPGGIEAYSQMNDKLYAGQITALNVITLIIHTIICLTAVFVISVLMGKWLKTPNRSLVTFMYLMFTVFFAISNRNGVSFSDDTVAMSILNIFDMISFSAALTVFYFFDVNALSKLTVTKREINRKLFTVTPTLFVSFYISFISLTSFFDKQATLVLFFFSTLILFLFIWAFYIIIRNINATNDATDARDQIKVLSVEVMEALAHTIDAKDKYTNGHSVRVAKYSRMIAERMGLDPEICEKIYYMALLHDIGKIGVPNEIINKPTRLTDSEYDIIKTHPVIGYDILSEIKSSPYLAYGARWHHERYDGRGYPDKKAGSDIPVESRIIAVADSYDAMTSNRSYRQYLPQEKVRNEVKNGIGTQFDPDAANCMLEIIAEDTDYILHE